MKKYLSILIIFMCAFLPVYARNWVEVTNKIYIDTDSIEPYINELDRIEKGKFVFWTKNLNDGTQNFKNFENEYNKKIWYVLDKEIISCNQKTLSVKTLIFYDLKGNVINNIEIPYFAHNAYSIAPDSIGELFYNGICK